VYVPKLWKLSESIDKVIAMKTVCTFLAHYIYNVGWQLLNRCSNVLAFSVAFYHMEFVTCRINISSQLNANLWKYCCPFRRYNCVDCRTLIDKNVAPSLCVTIFIILPSLFVIVILFGEYARLGLGDLSCDTRGFLSIIRTLILWLMEPGISA